MRRKITQRGVVLIVVLWVVALLTILLGAFVVTVKVERQTVADVSRGIQARAAADGVLNYLAALVAVAASELEEMPGQRYELVLNQLPVSFRLLPESAFIPVNTLMPEQLERAFSGLGLADAGELIQQGLEQRVAEAADETGKEPATMRINSFMHFVQVLGLDATLLRPYEPWLSFEGRHKDVLSGYVPEEVLDAFAVVIRPLEEGVSGKVFPWRADALYRLQVEVGESDPRRKIEMIVSFAGGRYRLLRVNEYNAVFSLNDSSGQMDAF